MCCFIGPTQSSAPLSGGFSTKSSGLYTGKVDNEGVIALQRDDFMGGAEEGVSAATAFLHAVNTFRNHCMERFGG